MRTNSKNPSSLFTSVVMAVCALNLIAMIGMAIYNAPVAYAHAMSGLRDNVDPAVLGLAMFGGTIGSILALSRRMIGRD